MECAQLQRGSALLVQPVFCDVRARGCAALSRYQRSQVAFRRRFVLRNFVFIQALRDLLRCRCAVVSGVPRTGTGPLRPSRTTAAAKSLFRVRAGGARRFCGGADLSGAKGRFSGSRGGIRDAGAGARSSVPRPGTCQNSRNPRQALRFPVSHAAAIRDRGRFAGDRFLDSLRSRRCCLGFRQRRFFAPRTSSCVRRAAAAWIQPQQNPRRGRSHGPADRGLPVAPSLKTCTGSHRLRAFRDLDSLEGSSQDLCRHVGAFASSDSDLLSGRHLCSRRLPRARIAPAASNVIALGGGYLHSHPVAVLRRDLFLLRCPVAGAFAARLCSRFRRTQRGPFWLSCWLFFWRSRLSA